MEICNPRDSIPSSISVSTPSAPVCSEGLRPTISPSSLNGSKNKNVKSSSRTQKLVVGDDICLPEVELMEELMLVGRAHGRRFGTRFL